MDGHALTLELAERGVVSLVGLDIPGDDSESLATAARERLTASCTSSWQKAPGRADDAHRELHTCDAEGGPVLVVGRFPSDLSADLWQVSIAVLDGR